MLPIMTDHFTGKTGEWTVLDVYDATRVKSCGRHFNFFTAPGNDPLELTNDGVADAGDLLSDANIMQNARDLQALEILL